MIGFSGLMIAWTIQATGVLSPGPGVALLLGVGLASGRRAAFAATFGIAICAAIYAFLTVVGLATVMAEAQWLILIVKALGATYLLWLAWGAFRRAAAPPPPPAAQDVDADPAIWRNVLRGFVMQISNPKAIFFWLAIAAVGSLQDANAATLAVFICGAFVISFVGHGAWAFVLSSHPLRRAYAGARRWIEGALGLFYVFAATKIATTRI